MTKESALRYFSRKTGVLLWLVGVIGLCMVYIGYSGERRSVIFMAVGAVLAVLSVYSVLHDRRHKKTGAELDAMADAAVSGRNLLGCALKQLCLDAGDVENCEKIPLYGYCALPIRTRPYFRRDETDEKLRSSNYQTSLMIFSPDRFYSYTYVVSLVDKENSESGRMWRYDQVAEARIVREDLNYLVGTSDEQRETAPIAYLLLKDGEGRGFSFFFDRTPEGEQKVERVLTLIRERSACVPAADLPPADDFDGSDDALSASPGGNSAARGRDLDVGVIGDQLQNPVR